MSSEEESLPSNRLQILNDDELLLILSKMTLREKIGLCPVSKQFNDCVNQQIKSQKRLKISVKLFDLLSDFSYKYDLKEYDFVFGEKKMRRESADVPIL
jgi:hypothetical protein